jgi:hypothetical protein
MFYSVGTFGSEIGGFRISITALLRLQKQFKKNEKSRAIPPCLEFQQLYGSSFFTARVDANP